MKYHRNAYGLPKFAPFSLKLTYSKHALERMAEKGIANVPQILKSRDCFVFEIEDTAVRKFALRTHYNQQYDLCLAVEETGFVRTAWLNRKNDRHCTLNREEYARPQ